VARPWTPLTIPAPTGLPATRTPTPTPSPAGPACYEGMANGGFETTEGWIIRSNPVLAAYVASPFHSGAASMRTGIAASGANTESYSPIEQSVAFPALPTADLSASLSLWHYNLWGDGALTSRLSPLPSLGPWGSAEGRG